MTRREERLTRPVRREMKPDPSDAADDAAGDFEQVETDRANGRRRQSRSGEDRAPEVREQQQHEAMELETNRIGAEAMTAEAIGMDIELEVVVPRHEIRGTPASIRDHEAQIEPLSGNIDLDEDASGAWPRLRAMLKTRANMDRLAGAV